MDTMVWMESVDDKIRSQRWFEIWNWKIVLIINFLLRGDEFTDEW